MRIIERKNPDTWYQNLIAISKLQSSKRYDRLFVLHVKTVRRYIETIRTLSEGQAQEKSNVKGDVRTKAGVVVHIMAWEEWQNQIFSSKDYKHLASQMKLQGYFDPDTQRTVDFRSVDEFNAYQDEKYKSWKWRDIQKKAIGTAQELQSFFPKNPSSDWLNFLETTPIHDWNVLPGTILSVPSGLYLWMVSLEHEAIEHARDLYIL